MDNFNLKKFLGEKSLLNENAPGYDTRKFGESLPTMESVKAAYEAKEDKDKLPDSIAAAEKIRIEKDARKSRGDIKEDDLNEAMIESQFDDLYQVVRNIYHVGEYNSSKEAAEEAMERIGQEFGVSFEFGRG